MRLVPRISICVFDVLQLRDVYLPCKQHQTVIGSVNSQTLLCYSVVICCNVYACVCLESVTSHIFCIRKMAFVCYGDEPSSAESALIILIHQA